VEEESQFGNKCGALGDCFGCNRPLNHEAVKRNRLIRRVFLILLCQLLLVIAMSLMAIFIKPLNDFLNNVHYFFILWIIATVVELASLITLFFVRHKSPLNLIVLFIFTVSSGYFVAFLSAVYDLTVILEAFFITTIIVSSLILYTMITRTDFHFLGVFCYVGVCVLFLWSIMWIIAVFAFGIHLYWLYQIFCLFGVLIFSMYLLYDISSMIHDYSCDEYIIVAVNIYLDVMNIFIYILAVFGSDH